MTTYATTYGWRSAGVRRGLMTSPPKQNPVNGGLKGPTRVHGTADPITTNQKAAGSSPAERANITSILQGFVFYPSPLPSGVRCAFRTTRVCHLRSLSGWSNGLQGVLRKPFDDFLRVFVGREHRVEDLLDPPVVDDERESLEQGHAPGFEHRQTQCLRKSQLLVAEELEREAEPLGRLPLVFCTLR